jgi:hypothetical protein
MRPGASPVDWLFPLSAALRAYVPRQNQAGYALAGRAVATDVAAQLQLQLAILVRTTLQDLRYGWRAAPWTRGAPSPLPPRRAIKSAGD